MDQIKIGQKVKCVSKTSMAAQFFKLNLNEIYTVVDLHVTSTGILLNLGKADGSKVLSKMCLIPAVDFQLIDEQPNLLI